MSFRLKVTRLGNNDIGTTGLIERCPTDLEVLKAFRGYLLVT